MGGRPFGMGELGGGRFRYLVFGRFSYVCLFWTYIALLCFGKSGGFGAMYDQLRQACANSRTLDTGNARPPAPPSQSVEIIK